MIVDGVDVRCDDGYSEDEIKHYIKQAREQSLNGRVDTMRLKSLPDGRVEIEYTAHYVKFERIRRITGYLVGTTDRWNNAKKSEERERVKHEVQD